MSRTYELVCHDCCVRLWVGQSDHTQGVAKAYIYTMPNTLKQQRDFLYGHLNHRLTFVDSETAPADYHILDDRNV